jgi:pre-rRNA-processing protein TSR3
MEKSFAQVPVRSLGLWRTAYPRTSKVFRDPDGGLATIEAIFAAYVALGRDAERLLDEYRWADDFRRLNAVRLPAQTQSV